MEMSFRAPTYRDPALHFGALRLIALHEGCRLEETLATENEREVLIRAPAHVHSAHHTAGAQISAHFQSAANRSGARALCVRSVSRDKALASAGEQGAWESGCGCRAD